MNSPQKKKIVHFGNGKHYILYETVSPQLIRHKQKQVWKF